MTKYKSENHRKFRQYKSIPYMISKIKSPNKISKVKFNELLKQEILDKYIDD